MSELTKIKISNKNIEIWPDFLKNFLLSNEQIFDVIDYSQDFENLGNFLHFSNDKLHYTSKSLGLMSFDFEELYNYHQRQKYALSKEPLAKALGIKGETKPFVWDATAGSGKDLVLIHIFGSTIVGFERNPTVFLLLQDALRRFPMDIHVEFGDCTQINSDSVLLSRPDIIYYDPMYPDKSGPKKSALPRKEMRIFKDIVGSDHDFSEFFQKAMTIAKDRVVIKRPLNSKDIGIKPTATYEGKSTRYDMYKVF